MCKKLVVLALVVAAGVFAYTKFSHKFNKKDISLEAQIHEQEQILASLDDEITKHLRQIAEREVDANYLSREIKDIETRQIENKKVLQAKRVALKSDSSLVTTGEKPDDVRRSEKELARLLDSYKRCEAELQAKKGKLEALEDAVASANEEVQAYQAERREQEVELNRLKAMVAQMRAEEIKSRVTFNKTKLSQVKKRTAELRKEIEVRKRQLELEGRYLGKSSKTDEKPRDILKEADELLGAKK
jgi:septal ring factor EnvC (AmiA/AmiB activator)